MAKLSFRPFVTIRSPAKGETEREREILASLLNEPRNAECHEEGSITNYLRVIKPGFELGLPLLLNVEKN